MQQEITLIIFDNQGRSTEVPVRSVRFTIGRSPDNDLALDDAGLSPRHALIENFDSIARISDCMSQGGTFLNGVPVTGACSLKHSPAQSRWREQRVRRTE
jgi:pSer/pThr/pTyr-binding forkhead associated (FHA) protein